MNYSYPLGSLFSVVLQDGWPSLACVVGRLALAGLCSVVL